MIRIHPFAALRPSAAHAAEVEITEEQERFVHWLRDHAIDRVRVE